MKKFYYTFYGLALLLLLFEKTCRIDDIKLDRVLILVCFSLPNLVGPIIIWRIIEAFNDKPNSIK